MPDLPVSPAVYTHHGHRRVDEYAWLRMRDDPRVLDYLDKENARTAKVLAQSESLTEALVAEMRARVPPRDSSLPYRHGRYLYYWQYEDEAEYPRYCRRGPGSGGEQILLDGMSLAADHDYFELSGFSVSPDHRRAAFAVDTVGEGLFTIYVVEFDTREIRERHVTMASDNFAWAADSQSLLYTRPQRDTLRDFQVWLYSGTGRDQLVYEETDDAYWVSVCDSLAGEHLFVTSESTLATEVRILPARNPRQAPRTVVPREQGHEYYLADGKDEFYVITNRGARNFRLCRCPQDDTRESSWTELVPMRNDAVLDDVEVFRDFIALTWQVSGLGRIELRDRAGGNERAVPAHGTATTLALGDNFEYAAEALRYVTESIVEPATAYDIACPGGQVRRLRQAPVGGDYRPADYRSWRETVEGRDGVHIPVTLVRQREQDTASGAPLLIEGYGAYGDSMEPAFDTDLASLLDRGWTYAMAHVRGGSECGRDWYLAGRGRYKMNSFLDFIDVTRGLQQRGYAVPEHTYAMGGSAGGLLVAAAANMAPGLYNGIVADVPFVDAVTTMLDRSLPLTTGEYDEWGDPRRRDDFFYMLGYSPYDNVRAQAYPHILATAAWHDSAVPYWEAAKWIGRLRDRCSNNPMLLLKTDLGAGHRGRTGRYNAIEDVSLPYTFLLHLEGMATTCDTTASPVP